MLDRFASLLIEGRLLETILKAERGSGVPRLRREPRLGRLGIPSARPHGLGAGKVLIGSGGTAGDGSTGSAAENRHGGAPRGAVPVATGCAACR
jgi:hypothetical protein